MQNLIRVNGVEHATQRYPTWADWEEGLHDTLEVNVSWLSDWRYMRLAAIHEIVEQTVCRYMGITQLAVDDFDIDYENRRVAGMTVAACGCPITQDPGSDIHAPYYTAHKIAEQIEYGLAKVIGVDAATYDKTCQEETEIYEKK